MNISDAGLKLIAEFEGFAPRLYNDPAGHCTIGYGLLVHLGPCDGRASETPFINGITEAEGRALLRETVKSYADGVEQHTDVPLTQAQFDALTSLAYNIGVGGYASSTVCAVLNAGRYDAVCDELRKYVKGTDGVTYPGLVRRREAECRLFQSVAAPPGLEDDMELLGQYAEQIPWQRSYVVFVNGDGNVRKQHVVNAAESDALASAGYPVKVLNDVEKIPNAT